METNFNAVSKTMAIEYNKKSEPYLLYYKVDKEGYYRKISPMQFNRLNLPDKTTKRTFAFFVREYLKKQHFGRVQVPVNGYCKKNNLTIDNNPQEIYEYIKNNSY